MSDKMSFRQRFALAVNVMRGHPTVYRTRFRDGVIVVDSPTMIYGCDFSTSRNGLSGE